MIKKDTIVSTTDGRLTLLQWLKKVEAALKNASATAVKGVPQADGKVVFEIDFADGTSIESEPFELPEKLPEGYAVDEAGNVTLNGSLLIDKLGNVEMGKNAVVDGTLTLNTPENLVFKTGAISSEPEGYAVDGAGNVTIAGALKANNNGDVQVNKDLVVDGNTLHLAGDLVRIKSYIQNSYLHFRVELKDRNFADDYKMGLELLLNDVGNWSCYAGGYKRILTESEAENRYSKARYQHTVTIKFDNQNTAVLVFTAMSSSNTKVTSFQNLATVFGNRRLECSGGEKSGSRFVYLDTNQSEPNNYVVGYLDATGFHTDETLGTLTGTGLTVEDNVCIP